MANRVFRELILALCRWDFVRRVLRPFRWRGTSWIWTKYQWLSRPPSDREYSYQPAQWDFSWDSWCKSNWTRSPSGSACRHPGNSGASATASAAGPPPPSPSFWPPPSYAAPPPFSSALLSSFLGLPISSFIQHLSFSFRILLFAFLPQQPRAASSWAPHFPLSSWDYFLPRPRILHRQLRKLSLDPR